MEAIEDYDQSIELNEEFSIAFNNRGIAKAELTLYEEAIADYTKAIELDNEYARAFYNRGNAKANSISF